MSSGKRTEAGTCDYCMTNPANRAMGDGSEICRACESKQGFQTTATAHGYRVRQHIPTIGHLRAKQNFASDKYAPCGCGCGKAAKFCPSIPKKTLVLPDALTILMGRFNKTPKAVP